MRQVGSLFWLEMSEDPGQDWVRSKWLLPRSTVDRYRSLFQTLLGHGVYLPPSPVEVGFLSTAHTQDDLTRLTQCIREWAEATMGARSRVA